MTPLPHQVEAANKLYDILKQKGYAYLAGLPRSGKTYTALLVCEKSPVIKNVLVLTKKNAIEGWERFTKKNSYITKNYVITNYEQVGKSIKSFKDFQLVIIDESHNIGAFPKRTQRTQLIRKLCWDTPHLHLSGTAIVESPCSIYHQMTISKYTPFNYKSFYHFHREWGISSVKYIRGMSIVVYDKAKPALLDEINKFTVYMTQEDAGIKATATDVLHYVELTLETKKVYNTLLKDKVLSIKGEEVLADTVLKLRVMLHQIEGGTLLDGANDVKLILDNTEKIDYIKNTFGDLEDVGIMCHFVLERQKLSKYFTKAQIYSSTSHAEGVDLSHLKHFIIYSSDYSGAKFIQRRERITNLNVSNTTQVHHILTKGAVSEQVYNIVSKKKHFNDHTYKKVAL